MSQLDWTQVIQQAFDDSSGGLKVQINSSLVPEQYDEIDLGYTGSDLTTVTYKYQSAVVTTLTLSYSGGNLSNIIKS